MTTVGGRFDFDDGGVYIGGWNDGKAHGLGLCTGPQCQGEYAGEWCDGFESCGVYIWPSGNIYEGAWMKGKRHGEGVEIKGRWIYKGEWGTGFKGRYGIRMSINSNAKYEGSWVTGVQDGFGVETYADLGTYQGQWMRGARHGYGIRQSAPFMLASHYQGDQKHHGSLTSVRTIDDVAELDFKQEEVKCGFVLTSRCAEQPGDKKKGFFEKKIRGTLLSKLRKPRSTGDITDTSRRSHNIRNGGSFRSNITDTSNFSFDDTLSRGYSPHTIEIVGPNVTETYRGEWKNDKRSGFGVCERSDGLKYEGEWYNNKKNGYGITYFANGTKDEGKFKNNCLVKSCAKHRIFALKSSRTKERVERAVAQARQAEEQSKSKAEQAVGRQAQARSRAELAEQQADRAKDLANEARIVAKEIAPEFVQPGLLFIKRREDEFGPIVGVGTSYFTKKKTPKTSTSMQPQSYISQQQQQQNQQFRQANTLSPQNAMMPTADSLQVSGGSRRGSFRSSYKRQGQNCATRQTSTLDQIPNNFVNDPMEAKITAQNYQSATKDPSRLKEPSREGFNAQMANSMSNYKANQAPSLGKMMNSTVIHDHFDQYRNPNSPVRYNTQDQYNNRDVYQQNNAAVYHTSDRNSTTTDSGISDISQKSHSRRRTLPSIMTAPPVIPVNKPPDDFAKSEISLVPSIDSSSKSSYIIENGIRKRVQAENVQKQTSMMYSNDLQPLPRNYRIESQVQLKKDLGEGSLPDVSMCKHIQQQGGVMTRDEVTKLSQARRQELYRELERRRQGEIIIRLIDVKTWCRKNVMVIIIFLINSVIAFMFVKLLSAAPEKH